VTVSPPKRIEQLSSVSHSLPWFQLCKNTVKNVKTDAIWQPMHFRDNCGWSCTAVRMWLIHLISSNMQ